MDDGSPISVLCVDDNDLVAGAVAAKLRMEGGFVWKGRLATADGLVATALRERPSVILLDIDMPGRDPLEAIQDLTEQGATSRVVIFSGHARPELLVRAIEAGAWGYVSKSDGEDALVEGIRSVASGEFALSPEVRAICGRG
jgi:two-component system response regulator DesR